MRIPLALVSILGVMLAACSAGQVIELQTPSPASVESSNPPQISDLDFSHSGVELHSVRRLGENQLLVVLTFDDMNPREVYTVLIDDQVYNCNVLFDVFRNVYHKTCA